MNLTLSGRWSLFGIDQLMSRTRIIVLALGMLAAGFLLGPTPDAAAREDIVTAYPPNVPYQGPIGVCTSPNEFECVESVLYRESTGAWRPALQIKKASRTWLVEYKGQTFPVKLVTDLLTPTFVHKSPYIGPRLMVSIERQPDRANPRYKPGESTCDPQSLATCIVYGPALPGSMEFKVAVRLSWMKPVGISAYGADGRTDLQAIPGGSRWTVWGRQELTPYSVDRRPDTEPSQYMTPMLVFWVVHKDTAWENTALNGECASSGFPATAANATRGGPPMWDEGRSALIFNIGAPHYDVRGKVFRGFFTARIPTSWIKCRWGVSAVRQSDFSISITTEDGDDIAVTKALRVARGQLKIAVSGFAYRSLTVSLIRTKSN